RPAIASAFPCWRSWGPSAARSSAEIYRSTSQRRRRSMLCSTWSATASCLTLLPCYAAAVALVLRAGWAVSIRSPTSIRCSRWRAASISPFLAVLSSEPQASRSRTFLFNTSQQTPLRVGWTSSRPGSSASMKSVKLTASWRRTRLEERWSSFTTEVAASNAQEIQQHWRNVHTLTPSPPLPRRKSGLPDLRKIKTRPGQARGARGREQTEFAARADSTHEHAPGVHVALRSRDEFVALAPAP